MMIYIGFGLYIVMIAVGAYLVIPAAKSPQSDPGKGTKAKSRNRININH